jgi:17beta-estradiol 17-dehydrogenase/3beta-hydroxysteroid 3-dehydrogenase/mitotic-spindle organizing protein 1
MISNFFIQEFETRLTFSKEEDTLLRLTEDPFSSDAQQLPINLQMEVTELQISSVYRNKHRESSLPEFYSSLDVTKFKNLRDSALQVCCVFGSTYTCEQTFSIINMDKSKQRASLTDEYLEDTLRTSATSMVPEYEKLIANKKYLIIHR